MDKNPLNAALHSCKNCSSYSLKILYDELKKGILSSSYNIHTALYVM